MTQHKWHKEIKAWADGAEIEMWYKQYDGSERWIDCKNPQWGVQTEYRIKPQPKEPQYLYVYGNEYVTCTSIKKSDNCGGVPCIGKIKLEVDDEKL